MIVKSKKLLDDKKSNSSSKNFLILISILVGIISITLVQKLTNKPEEKRLKYWGVCLRNYSTFDSSLGSMDRIFNKLNYEFVNPCDGDDFDIMWAIQHPWDEDDYEHPLFCNLSKKNILPHQKVLHFPGIASLISKSLMSFLNRGENFILPAFDLKFDQQRFDKFVKENPNKTLLEKNYFNRGVKIIKVEDIDPKKEDTFYQEFMDKPFLIDGRAFDLGIYVLITSFDPIRAYRYSDDNYLRITTENYYPFDPNNRKKYVIDDECIEFQHLPFLADPYFKYYFSAKIMFEDLIRKKGFDVKAFWERIDDAIAKTVMNAENNVLKMLSKENRSSHNFFEIVRFDTIYDVDLNPYVVEVNMSPNLTPAVAYSLENNLLYKHVVHNIIKMIGGGSYHEFWSRFDSTDTIVTNHKNLATSIENCMTHDCVNNCNNTLCHHCQVCMSDEIRYQLKEALREHQQATNFKRVFPTAKHFNDEEFFEKMTKNNQIQLRWWKGKCEDDERWC